MGRRTFVVALPPRLLSHIPTPAPIRTEMMLVIIRVKIMFLEEVCLLFFFPLVDELEDPESSII